jgi:hypothetical protein
MTNKSIQATLYSAPDAWRLGISENKSRAGVDHLTLLLYHPPLALTNSSNARKNASASGPGTI